MEEKKKKRFILRVGIALSLVVTLFLLLGYRFSLNNGVYKPIGRNESTVENDGIRLTVKSVHRVGAELHLLFGYENVGGGEGWPFDFGHPWYSILVHFYDSQGNEVSCMTRVFWIGNLVRSGATIREDEAITPIPMNAEWVAVTFFSSTTKPIAIPR